MKTNAANHSDSTMGTISIFFHLLILGLFYESSADWRIFGGHPAEEGAYPYQVSIRITDIPICGGAIVAKRTVITTVHCLYAQPLIYTEAVVGTNLLDLGGDRYPSTKFLFHPDYDRPNIFNDIALMIVNRDIIFGDKVQIIPLNYNYIGSDVKAVFTGWGNTENGGIGSNELNEIKVKTITYEQCKNSHTHPVIQSQICTLSKIGEGVCYGDSGGPLVVDGKLIGVASWVTPCAKGDPDVYSRISSFAEWIDENQI